MFDFVTVFFNDLTDQVLNPQKRVFFGYLLTSLCIAVLWLVFIEKRGIVKSFAKIFDKNIWFGQSSRGDFKILLVNRVLFSSFGTSIISQITIATLIYNFLMDQPFIAPLYFNSVNASFVVLLFTLTFFIFDDFSRFYLHRLMHKLPFLWAFHRVHHSAETLTPFTIFRTHPVEGVLFVLRTALVQGIVISSFTFLFGNKVDLFTIYGVNVAVVIFHGLGSNLRHSHIKIRYPKLVEFFLISPAQHQIHHSIKKCHYDKNFGVVLAIWDYLFGSLHHSEPGEHQFGVKNYNNEHSIKTLLVTPFQLSFGAIMRQASLISLRSDQLKKLTPLRRFFIVVLALTFSFGVLIQNAKASDLNIYSHRQPYLIEPFLKAFTKSTGIRTKVVFSPKGLAQRLLAEGPSSPADVVLTVDIGRLKAYSDKGLFRPVKSEILDKKIPEHLKSKAGSWFGFSKRTRVIAVSNKSEAASKIERFEDLASPDWKGKICSRPGSHVYNRALLSSIIAANGEEQALKWAQAIVENFARRPRGNDRSQIKAIFAGECEIALVNHYYYGKLRNSEDPEHVKWAKAVKIIIPNQGPGDRGAHINISGGGIAKHSKNFDKATKFLEFLVSDQAQKLYASVNYEYPVTSGVELPKTLTQWGNFREDSAPIESIAALSSKSQKIIDTVGW